MMTYQRLKSSLQAKYIDYNCIKKVQQNWSIFFIVQLKEKNGVWQQKLCRMNGSDGTILADRQNHLHIMEFQFWAAACELDALRHWARRVLVTPDLNQPERCVIGELCHSSVVGVSCGGPVQKSGHHGHQPVRLGGVHDERFVMCSFCRALQRFQINSL